MGTLGRGDARERADDLVADDHLGTRDRPVALDRVESAQEPVHVPATVDAAHELLAEEAALGERDRIELELGLLRNRLVVDVDGLERDAPLDAERLERLRPDRRSNRRRVK